MYTKQLLEDINSVVNEFNSGDDRSEKEATEDISQITNEDNYAHEYHPDVHRVSHGSTPQEYDTQHMHNYSLEQVLQLCNAKIKKHGVGLVAKHLESI